MNKYVTSETNQHVMKLIQMGASVTAVSSQMVYVTFDITPEIQVSYVYNINKKNKYFLERIKPYPLPVRAYDSADDLCKIIKIDVEQFKNAVKSHNVYEFIKASRNFHDVIMMFEDLFLYYNVKPEILSKIEHNIKDIFDTIKDAREKCPRVYFKKEPESLPK